MVDPISSPEPLDSPSLNAISLDDTKHVPLVDSPQISPGTSPGTSPIKSPTFSATSASQTGISPGSPSSSPLLLAMDHITPLTSRDEDSAIYSDSDVASQSSNAAASRGRDSMQKDTRSKSKGRGSSRRRRSDASERSNRSVRSSSGQRGDKVTPTNKIFRNLLILEESLRQQSQDQRILRRKFTAFLATLAGLAGFCFYSLYCADKRQSPFTKVLLQFTFFFILVTLVLFHLSGEYRRTIIIPRRFFTSTNKGLRQLNLRLVKVKTPIGDRFIDLTRSVMMSIVQLNQYLLDNTGPLQNTNLGQWAKNSLKTLEIRAQPRVGATDVKLTLNPRAFNSEIRESWELYRDEFWAREGSRRRHSSADDQNQSQNVLDKGKLVEKHRKERKDRRRSRNDDARASTSGLTTGIDLKQLGPEAFIKEKQRRSV